MNYEAQNGMELELTVDAPQQEVFDVIAATDRWPDLFTCITGGDVLTDHSVGEDVQMEWEVTILGVPIHVREMIDAYERPRKFTWRSVEESSWNHEGAVECESVDSERTRVYTYMDYDLPGVVNNRVTKPLFKRRFQSEIEKSLDRVEQIIEANAYDRGTPSYSS